MYIAPPGVFNGMRRRGIAKQRYDGHMELRQQAPHEGHASSLDNHFDGPFLIENVDPDAIGIALQPQADAPSLCP